MKRLSLALSVFFGLLYLCENSFAGEIIPTVKVVSSPLQAPINEQPYYGFLEKSAQQKVADEQLLADVAKMGVTREAAADRAVNAAWQFITGGKFDEAAKRLNQAWILQPDRSDIAHFFAIVVQERFKNPDYAYRLFEVAAKLKNPRSTLPADHARVLLMNRQPQAAIPYLEAAIRQSPNAAVPKANLAFALFEVGQIAKACEALSRVSGQGIESVRDDLSRLKTAARC